MRPVTGFFLPRGAGRKRRLPHRSDDARSPGCDWETAAAIPTRRCVRRVAAKPQLQLVRDEVAKDGVGRSEFLELVEDQLDHAPCLLVGLLDDLPGGHLEVADGNVQEQLATLRLVPAAAQQAIPKRDQFKFAHGALHSQKEPIVAVQGIVDAILIAQQRVEDAAHIDELMPVLVGSRQPAEFQPQDHPDVIQAHLRHQPLKPRALVGGLAALSLILVDHHDALGRPAQALGELRQSILPLARLAVLEHLLWRGLPHIDHRQTVQMHVTNLRCRAEPKRRWRPGESVPT